MMQIIFAFPNDYNYVINRKKVVKRLRIKSGGKKMVVFDITIHTVDITYSTSA